MSAHQTRNVRIAVTVGDPRGIGPEILPAALKEFLTDQPQAEITVLGDRDSLQATTSEVRAHPVGVYEGSLESAGLISLRAIEEGVRMAILGHVDAIVTGPVHKPALHSAGAKHPGQTELLQALTGAPSVGMLMHADRTALGAPIRILLATTHIPHREVASRLTRAKIREQVGLLWRSLRAHWGIPAPSIALCALNPHASDGGLFGDEEATVLSPAVRELRESGIDVTGPMPADTVFLRMIEGDVDAVVAPYHDVGMAVFKTLSFGRGTNVTLGLPFPRTSPDHGTAFDRVGAGTADHKSLTEALRLASRLALRHGAAAL